jgi:hypothetical protein
MFNRLIKRTLAGGLVIAAAAFPATGQAFHPIGGTFSSSTSSTPIVTVTPAPQGDSSFQWGDAGIGAGAALLLSGGVAGAAITRRRRVQRLAVG